ncbi:MAG: putative Ig domain-containing protein, partial [Planctomycetales bacterium]|nr:putative Ig domain-containing protein [Planctomycetales bacterium]
LLTGMGIPSGASFDPSSGQFSWVPGFDQAGTYSLSFQLIDSDGLFDTTTVSVVIANVDRSPVLSTSNHQATLGKLLTFPIVANDPDQETLTYSAIGLPEGATVDAATGMIQWIPGPAQAGEYAVTVLASDGQLTASQSILIKASVVPTPPNVTLELTPGFPVLPNQVVRVHVIADSLAPIAQVSLMLDGQAIELDERGQATILAGSPGKLNLQAVAVDADGIVGTVTRQFKVRDPSDTTAPVALLDPVDGQVFNDVTDLIGTINDANLDFWTLEIAPQNGSVFTEMAKGQANVDGGKLASLDPQKLANGFYKLRLTAEDIGRRRTVTTVAIEINTATKSAIRLSSIDAVVTLGGIEVPIARTYDSLGIDSVPATVGNGWRLANRDVEIQVNVPSTGRETLGVYEALREGTRLYLTLPNGQRGGFSFHPVAVSPPGLPSGFVYYRPNWLADSGVNYQLESVDTLLIRGGDRYYDQASGRPYHPADSFFEGSDYVLRATDGSYQRIDSQDGVTESVSASGSRLRISDSGIVADNGDAIQFVYDTEQRLAAVKLPGGDEIHYLYVDGNLSQVVSPTLGLLDRYGYGDGILRVAVDGNGNGQALQSDKSPIALTADLGDAIDSSGVPYSSQLTPGGVHRFAYSIDAGQIASTATNQVLLRVVVERDASSFAAAVPVIAGLQPVSASSDANRAVALFSIDKANTYLLEIRGATSTDGGAYRLRVDIAGDINGDATVDGTDSALLDAAIGSVSGDFRYLAAADLDANGVIDASDRQILARNFGFASDRAVNQLQDYFHFSGTDIVPLSQPAPLLGAGPASSFFVSTMGPFKPTIELVSPLHNTFAIAGGLSAINQSSNLLIPTDNAQFGIQDGDFEMGGVGWTTRGDVNIDNGIAVLSEDTREFSGLLQSFFVPQDAKFLRFTILDFQLGSAEFHAPDAFEVSIVDPNTLQPLLGTANGLTDSDALLNVQSDGTIFTADGVTIYAAGGIFGNGSPRVVEIDVSQLSMGTLGAITFDLLGFGDSQSRIVIDNVLFASASLGAPVAGSDLVATDEDVPIMIDVLANDSAAATLLSLSSIDI